MAKVIEIHTRQDVAWPCPKCGCDNRWQIIVDEDTEDEEAWEARAYHCAVCGMIVECPRID